MKTHNNTRLFILLIVILATLLSACQSDVKHINELRSYTIFNPQTQKLIVTIEGRCELNDFEHDGMVILTCEVKKGKVFQNFFGPKSTSFGYTMEELGPAKKGEYYYKAIYPATETPIPTLGGSQAP